MGLVSEQGELPQELQDTIRSKKCVAFIGSGLSAGSYDSWPVLIIKLCKHCGIAPSITSTSTGDALLDAAQEAKDADVQKYHAFLGEHFGRPATHASLLYDAIFSLPFDSYLTVNFDPLLALKSRTARPRCDTNIRDYPSLDRKNMGKRSIHYLHGRIIEGSTPANGTIVLSSSEFADAYSAHSSLMNLLVPTFENDPVVFVGCRLEEPVMKPVFDICKQHQEARKKLIKELRLLASDPPRRFILLPDYGLKKAPDGINAELSQTANKSKEEYYRNMNIEPVWYPATDGGDHSVLRYALERLAELPEIPANHGWNEGVIDAR